ncbi:hypothetical protein [Streptomyces sp. NPDC007205]|uniref:alpha/beta fold hydrolase n=1 Tax=Streptomyces sp. NPDC007205 TaxID=3154316 RepID=UPI0033EFC091
MWDAQFTVLAAGYRVIRYDWRGRGASGDVSGSSPTISIWSRRWTPTRAVSNGPRSSARPTVAGSRWTPR